MLSSSRTKKHKAHRIVITTEITINVTSWKSRKSIKKFPIALLIPYTIKKIPKSFPLDKPFAYSDKYEHTETSIIPSPKLPIEQATADHHFTVALTSTSPRL